MVLPHTGRSPGALDGAGGESEWKCLPGGVGQALVVRGEEDFLGELSERGIENSQF